MQTISVNQLHKTFTMGTVQVPVLKDLNFNIQPGEFVSIMGPSGCGKSTLLYLLGGLDSPTQGDITINNRLLSKLKDKEKSLMRKRDLGFVFQFYNLVPNLSVEDNILLPIVLDKKNIKDYKNKLEELLTVIDMTDKRHHTPRELSGGQQQRVAIARALIFDPDILLLDEPTGNLDTKNSIEIMSLFKKINQTYNKTIIQVTHSKEFAEYGTRIIKLKDGQIENETLTKASS